MDDLALLRALCSPPDAPVRPVHSGASGALPPSHTRLVDDYGVGCFDEFLWIYGEGAENKNLDVHVRSAWTRSYVRRMGTSEVLGVLDRHGVLPEELVSWGGTDNADLLIWLPVGEPEDWPTLVVESGQLSCTVLTGTSTRIVFDLLTGKARAAAFPDDFPSDAPSFSANPYT
ncbi:hypothetical protein [Saccharothrix longispora]|uniref:hypothetical protein n=1 Tax=Saccharothrix longispora TaxID=33920 RepID=UPI0028FD9640|nr:hypothetical protein [Saccharothrix longispora]MDU0288839.1 hypothetical protein [Saccharothrix longispora]